MILENAATIRLLSALVEVGAEGADRAYLLSKAGVANTTFYRVLKPLVRRGLVTEQGERYVLPLDNSFNFQFKRLHDVERLYELDEPTRNRVLTVQEMAKTDLKERLRALWLVGSAAHRNMQATSDLDFLAVVSEGDYHPSVPYPVHFTVMTEEEFQERFSVAESFVLTALRYGLLLEDQEFAQSYVARPIPVELSARALYERTDEVEERRESTLFFLSQKAREEAGESLRGYAVTVARRILRLFGVLPAGKPDLLRGCRLLLGTQFAALIEQSVRDDFGPDWRSEMALLTSQLAASYERFSSQAAHFQELAVQFVAGQEQFARGVLEEIFDPASWTWLDRYADGILRLGKRSYLVQIKSLKGPCQVGVLERLEQARKKLNIRCDLLVVANPYSGIPLLEQAASFSDEFLGQARAKRIRVISFLDLARYHNAMHLMGLEPAEVGQAVLGLHAQM